MKSYLLVLAAFATINGSAIEGKLNNGFLKEQLDASIDESISRHLEEKIVSQYNVSSEQYSVKVGVGRGLSSTSSYSPSDLAGLRISLKSRAFGNYMRAPKYQDWSINTQTYVGDWEKWTLVQNSDDGSYSLKSVFNWYLSVRGGGAEADVISAGAIGAWERLSITNNNGVWCIKSNEWGNYLRASGGGYDSNVNTQTGCYAWEEWVPELQLTPKSISITYNPDNAQVVTGNPMSIAQNVLDNSKGTVSQSLTYSVAKTLTATTTFSQTTGVSFTQSIEVSVGVPNVSSGKISLSSTEKVEKTYGKSSTETFTFTSSFTLIAPAGKIYKGVASVYQSSYSIPYTAVLSYEETSVTSTLTGTYSGVAYYNLFYSVYDITA